MTFINYETYQPLIEIALGFFPILAGAIFFQNFRSHFLSSSLLYNKNILQKVNISILYNFFRGLLNTLKITSLHTSLSAYMSFLVSGHYKVRQILPLILGAQAAILFSFLFLILVFSLPLTWPFIYLVTILCIISAFFPKLREAFYTLFFLSLFLFATFTFLNNSWFSGDFNIDTYAIFAFPLLAYFLFPSSFIFIYLNLAILWQMDLANLILPSLPFFILLSVVLLQMRIALTVKIKTSKILTLQISLFLLVLFQALITWSQGAYLHPIYSFLISIFLALFLSPYILKLSQKTLRKRRHKEVNVLEWFHLGMINSTDIDLEILSAELRKKSAFIFTMLQELYNDLSTGEYKLANEKRMQKYEKISDNMQSEIIHYSEHLMTHPMPYTSSLKIRAILKISDQLESIADSCITMYKLLEKSSHFLKKEDMGGHFLRHFAKTLLYYEKVFEDLRDKDFFTKNDEVFKRALKLSQDLSDLKKEISLKIEKQELSAKEVAQVLEWLHQMRKIKSCTSNIFQAYQGIR